MKVNLLIIGAGPFGLAMAAYAQQVGIPHVVVGHPMEFWKVNMPTGMHLRSACDWHLDPMDVHTIDAYLGTLGKCGSDVEPLSLPFYLSYVKWFQQQKQITPLPLYVKRLDHTHTDTGAFQALMSNGQVLLATHVVLAVGFKYFKQEPAELTHLLPIGRFTHTCDAVKFDEFKQKSCLVVGGRQSAFEWTALISEAGASAVHVSYRHDSPRFESSDWAWVSPIVDNMVVNPSWFRKLSAEEKEEVSHRLWAEGRLKVEPWLESRVTRKEVKLWPNTRVVGSEKLINGDLVVKLDNDRSLVVDHVILATGYKVQMKLIPFLAQGNILNTLATINGFPVLDDHFETNVPGLFVTSLPASQHFGPFFAFTVAVRTSAKVIGEKLLRFL